MTKQFYSHIIEIHTVDIEIDALQASEKEKEHLKHLVDKNIYHTVMDMVLSELDETDRKMFLDKIVKEDHAATLDFLKKRILNIEEKIRYVAKGLISELHQDIKEAK